MTTMLTKPWRIDRRGERIYIDAPGEVCINIESGAKEDRARVLALVGQAQRMAALLKKHLAGHGGHNCHTQPPECSICGPIEQCLRDAGVLEPERQMGMSSCAELCDFEPCRKAGRCDG